MKKVFVIMGSLILLCLQSFSQTSSSQTNRAPSIQNLIGRWEIVGTKDDGGRLEILDSSTIVITYGGEKKALSGFKLDFSKSPIWFDFFVKDSSATMNVKSIMEVISDDLIKWQVFMNDERASHFTSEKGELFYLKRIKVKSVTTFVPQWDKKNYVVLRN